MFERGVIVLGPLYSERPTVRDPRVDPTAPVCTALRRLGVWHRPGSDEVHDLGIFDRHVRLGRVE